jgi:hypothetical protein
VRPGRPGLSVVRPRGLAARPRLRGTAPAAAPARQFPAARPQSQTLASTPACWRRRRTRRTTRSACGRCALPRPPPLLLRTSSSPAAATLSRVPRRRMRHRCAGHRLPDPDLGDVGAHGREPRLGPHPRHVHAAAGHGGLGRLDARQHRHARRHLHRVLLLQHHQRARGALRRRPAAGLRARVLGVSPQ